MKILLTMNQPYFPVLVGGANKANRVLAEQLIHKHHTVQVVVPARNPLSRTTHQQFRDELITRGVDVTTRSGVEVFRLNDVEVHAVAELSQLRAHLVNQIDCFKPDWTLVSSEDGSQNLLDAALRACPGRVTYLVHTPTYLPFGPQAFYPSAIRTELLQRAAALVVPSHFLAQYIRQWSGLESKVFYWPTYGAGPFARLGNFNRGFVTMVNPCAVKGIAIFLALAQSLPDVQFAYVPTWGTTPLDRQALAQLGNVRLVEPAEDFEQILALTNVLLMPSLWQEAFGLTVVETMLRAIPVLASNVGGLPEAKLGTDLILPVRPIEQFTEPFDERMLPVPVVPEQDIAPWRAALSRLLSDREFYETQATAAHTAATEFVASLSIDPFEELLQHLAAKPATDYSSSPYELQSRHQRSPLSQTAVPRVVNGAAQNVVVQNVAALSPEQRALLILRLQKKAAQKQQQPNGNTPANPLIKIQHGSESKRAFFCVHPVTGDVACYLDLAAHLGKDQPFYGLQYPSLNNGQEAYLSIENLAARYVAAVQVVQPTGPYFLGGWSMGGVVAYEMARLLHKQNQMVALVALIDSWATPVKEPGREGAATLPGSNGNNGNSASDHLCSMLEHLAQPGSEAQLSFALDQAKAARLVPPDTKPSQIRGYLHTYKNNTRAVQSYVPQKHSGQVVLLQAGEQAAVNKEDQTNGWKVAATAGLTVHQVPGNHYTMLREPHVQVLAAKLKAYLQEAKADQASA